MKFAVIITILMVASFHVATAKTLAEAMYELRPIMNLHSWDAAWNLRRNADYAVRKARKLIRNIIIYFCIHF